jgi:hypothetical protein
MPIPIRVRHITWRQAAQELEEIHGEVQRDFHDKWNWLHAGFCLEVLKTELERLEKEHKHEQPNPQV